MDEDWDIKPAIFGIMLIAGMLWLLYEIFQWVLG